MTPVTYRKWSLGYGHASRQPPYDEGEARRRFEAGETVWVLFGDPDRPEIVLRLDLGGRLVEVTWLDELNRPEMSYLFTQPEGFPDDELFLEQVHVRTYDHDIPVPDGVASSHETWFFKPEGTLAGFRSSLGRPAESTEGRIETDQMPIHRERRPGFGEWSPLIVRDREP